MRFTRASVCAVAVSLLAAAVGTAQVTFRYTFGGTPDPLTALPTSTTGSGATAGAFSIGNSYGGFHAPLSEISPSGVYSGASGGGNFSNAVKSGSLDPTTSAYYSVTIDTRGADFVLNKFDFGSRGIKNGPELYAIRSSVNGFATDLASGAYSLNGGWFFVTATPAATPLVGTDPVEFRLYTYGGINDPTSGDPNHRIDDVAITVTVVPVPVPEPAAVLAVGAGVLAAAGRLRRRGHVS